MSTGSQLQQKKNTEVIAYCRVQNDEKRILILGLSVYKYKVNKVIFIIFLILTSNKTKKYYVY